MYLLVPGLRLLKLLSLFLPLLCRFSANLITRRKMLNNSFVRLIDGGRDIVTVTLEHRVDDSHCVVFGTLSYTRLTADIHIMWTVDCPLTIREKFSEIIRFVKLCRSL